MINNTTLLKDFQKMPDDYGKILLIENSIDQTINEIYKNDYEGIAKFKEYIINMSIDDIITILYMIHEYGEYEA